MILFGHMHIHRYGMYLTWYIGRDGICHLLKIISNFFMKSISRCAQNTNTLEKPQRARYKTSVRLIR